MTGPMMKFVLPFSLMLTAKAQSGLQFSAHYVLGGFFDFMQEAIVYIPNDES